MSDPGSDRFLRRIVAASMSGTAVEWYDFAIYGTAATLVFSTQFFPSHDDPLAGIIEAFVTYAVGFAARPLGGIVFGHFGDLAIEAGRGLLVACLRATGRKVYAINPKAVDRYRSVPGEPSVTLQLVRLFVFERGAPP